MCRWIAYRGETIALEHYVTTPAHSLISQSIQALESTASVNGDGFGLGWYGIHPEPGLYREIRPAWSDENLRHLCRHNRTCSLLTFGPLPGPLLPGRTVIRSHAGDGCSCTMARSVDGAAYAVKWRR